MSVKGVNKEIDTRGDDEGKEEDEEDMIVEKIRRETE